MSPPSRLNQRLLERIAALIRKSTKYTREQISKRASRLGISAEASQIIWARKLGLGTAHAFRGLPPHLQEQVRTAISSTLPAHPINTRSGANASTKKTRIPDPVATAAEYLLVDAELRSRCIDLLRSKKHQDRVFREATVVLENRIRSLSGVTERMNPGPLVSQVLNPDPSRAILIVSNEPSEQLGFHNICLGIILLFRDKSHHRIDDRVTREDALRFCSFVDVLLGLLSKTTKRP